ncbi:CHAP domain-containing protein [Sinorhizobium sp. BG8]|uniref:CHAP domain-containing protein n=1 Tax=Sinorhizobium sp. BG8 TaxID=2613773 RepID=UPI00193EB259|nr:CHAP domain-containing protein [Sinorhizobium sp. BG8]
MLLKRGMIGAAVGGLVNDLIAVGFSPDSGPGNNFNAGVERAVKAFQSANIGPNLLPLVIDGQVGPLTRYALDVALGHIAAPVVPNVPLSSNGMPASSSQTGWNALQVARRELASNSGETSGDNLGPDIDRYRAVTGAAAGASWCASFVSYCFDDGNPGHMPFAPDAGARAVLKKFKQKGWDYEGSLVSPPAPGDIIVWWRVALNHWMGHIGIVDSYEHGIVTTIEGNRGAFPSTVRSYSYVLGKIDKLLGFGRAAP